MRPHPIVFLVLAPILSSPTSAQDALEGDPWTRFVKQPWRVMTAHPVADHEHESDLAWGDLDHDGDIDLVVARKEPFISFGKRTNLLLMNEGGVFVDRTARYASASDVDGDRGFLTPTNDRDVALGDFDGDGWLDVVTAVDVSPYDPKHLSHPRIYRNLGADEQGGWRGIAYEDARFPALKHFKTGEMLTPRFMSVTVGDIDDDGDLDLYFGDHDVYPDAAWGDYEAPELDGDDRLLVNDGTGVFEDMSEERVDAKMRESRFCNAVVFADLNGDKRIDLIRQSGHGTPTSAVYNDPENPGHFGPVQEIYKGSPYFISTGDLNQDGRLDLVISENDLDVVIYNEGVGDDGRSVWSKGTPFTFIHGEDDRFAGNSVIADLDGDGWNDVIITDVDPEIESYDRRTHIYHNRGGEKGGVASLVEEREKAEGGWIGAVGLEEDDLRGAHDAAVFDVDGDGRQDLVLSRLGGTDVWRQVDADYTPTVTQFRAVEGAFPPPNEWTEGIAFGDADQDGDLDVFLARGEGWGNPGRKHQNALFINKLDEDQPFRFVDESVERLGYSESHARDVVTADVNGDGYIDALYVNGFNTAPPYLFINRGADRPGHFRMESDARGLTETLSSSSASFGDVDNDGDLDLVISDAGASYIGPPGGRPRLYLNDGDGRFVESPGRLAAPLKIGPMGVHLVDVDGDFDLDFFGPNRPGRSDLGHYLMLNTGDGHFHDVSHLLPETTGSVYEADNADLDGDGDIDFLFTSLSRIESDDSRFPLGEGPVKNLLAESGELSFELGTAIGVDDDNDVALFDYDQDGDLDAFISSLGPKEKLLRNDGGLSFQFAEGVIQTIKDPSLDLGIADLDNDRAADLVTAQGLERIGVEQPPCQAYRNFGPKDRTPPRVLAEETLPEPSRHVGPWVVRANVQDDVVADGDMYLRAEAWYVLNDAPRRVEVAVADPQQGLDKLNVEVGTTVTWKNTSEGELTARGAIGRVAVDETKLAPGESFSATFVQPGTYSFRFGRRARAEVVVTGSPWSGRALQAGSGLWRFQFDGHGPASELCYQLRFVDRAGNDTLTLPRVVTLSKDAGRRRGGRRR